MTEPKKQIPIWILIVSGLIALAEVMVSISLVYMPQEVLETVDLNAKGVDYIVQMWGVRQLALGVIFGYATFKKSVPMLTLAYVFFLVMMVGDMVIGIAQKENALVIASAVTFVISVAMIYAINKKR